MASSLELKDPSLFREACYVNGEWIAAEGARIGPLVAAQPGVAQRCRPEPVIALFQASGKRERFAAWTLLFFALWHQHHVLGISNDGDAFDALA